MKSQQNFHSLTSVIISVVFINEMNIDSAKFADLVMRGMACVIGGGVISGGNRCQVLDG